MAEKEYVEREALLYEIDKCEPMNWTGSDAENQADIDHACYRGLVETAPSADVVEVRHGKWVIHADGSGTCDQCNTTQKNVWDFDNWQNYCGHCGADMRGVTDTNVGNKSLLCADLDEIIDATD